MPNHVPCILTVSGAPKDVDEFIEFAKGPAPAFKESEFERDARIRYNKAKGLPEDSMPEPSVSPFQCAKFVPVPPEILAREYGSNGDAGYNWCIAAWGTKWGAYDCQLAKTGGDGWAFAAYTFNCAWSPCLPVIEAAALRFPGVTLHLRWCDPYDNSHHKQEWPARMKRVWSDETESDVMVPVEGNDHA